MAKSKNGANGPVRGRIGNLVYTEWKGVDIVKRAPVRTAPFSEKQLFRQHIFKLAQEWLKPITPFVRMGYNAYTSTTQGFTAAKSFLLKHALVINGNEASIDPSLMLVSYGELPLPPAITMELNEEKELLFTWDTSLMPDSAPLDQVLLLAYNVEKEEPFYSLGGNFRRTGSAVLPLTHASPGEFHVYLALVAEDKSRQSNSTYLGTVSIPE